MPLLYPSANSSSVMGGSAGEKRWESRWSCPVLFLNPWQVFACPTAMVLGLVFARSPRFRCAKCSLSAFPSGSFSWRAGSYTLLPRLRKAERAERGPRHTAGSAGAFCPQTFPIGVYQQYPQHSPPLSGVAVWEGGGCSLPEVTSTTPLLLEPHGASVSPPVKCNHKRTCLTGCLGRLHEFRRGTTQTTVFEYTGRPSLPGRSLG